MLGKPVVYMGYRQTFAAENLRAIMAAPIAQIGHYHAFEVKLEAVMP